MPSRLVGGLAHSVPDGGLLVRQGITHYTANTGTAALRAAICAKFERENGLQYAPNEVVVSNGAKQSVWQGLLGTCSPGDEVLFSTLSGSPRPHLCQCRYRVVRCFLPYL